MEKEVTDRIRIAEKQGWRPHQIADLLSLPINTILTYFIDQEIVLNKIEKDYYENEWPKVQEGIKEWIQDVPEDQRREMKRQGLLEQLQELKKDPSDPRLPKLVKDIKIFTGRVEGISPEKIARASAYPITQLIKSTRGMAICPFHADKSPSMDVRKNFYYCYGCGEHGNAIDLIRKLEGLTFKEAVEKLN